jgi:hypothetical protein
LLNIFPNKPFGTNQKMVFKNLLKINETRNRIAHHEPICFNGNIISAANAQSRYDLIVEMLHWLKCNPKILYGINGVQQAINMVNSI